jgi:hypothetical protein
VLEDTIIAYTDEYVYLGSPISNAPVPKQVASHIEKKQSHVRKFSAFVSKNEDAPYTIKKTVWKVP